MIKKLLIIIIALLLFSSSTAIEIVVGTNIAQIYRDAGLVIIGDVISISTRTISERDSLESDGWIHIYRTLVDTYYVRVDSVLKGSYGDSLIIIESKNYPDYPRRRKFTEINEKEDSLFVTECTHGFGYEYERVGKITKLGKGIILLKNEDDSYISMLYCNFSEDILDFFREAENKKTVIESD